MSETQQMRGPKMVVIGGGTGSFTLLKDLKNYVQDITALVNMIDDGGSSGMLRDEQGVLPPGDVRQCLVALSRSENRMRELFDYRFSGGSLEGHTFGNLFLSVVEKSTADFAQAVALASEVLDIQGRVIPVTLSDSKLVLKTKSGREIRGEYAVGHGKFSLADKPKLELEPAAEVNREAIVAIESADMVVIAPGNLYGSILPALIVKGVSQALKTTKAKVVMVINLMNNNHNTHRFSASDYINECNRSVGTRIIDFVLFNSKPIARKLISRYAQVGEEPVSVGLKLPVGVKLISADLLAEKTVRHQKGDRIKRSLIRHDGDKVARQLMKLYYS